MAQQINERIINPDLDNASFNDQIARINAQFTSLANETDKIQARMQSALTDLVKALKSVGDAGESSVSNMRKQQSVAAAHLNSELPSADNTTGSDREKFLSQLKAQLVEQKLSSAELLRMKAAQVGAGDAAEVYIRKLEGAKTATRGLGLDSAEVRRELGMLAAELLRGNFGALIDSGISLASRAGWIDQLMTLRGLGIAGVVGGITGSIALLGKAWYEGSKESEEFNKQLILTGNYANVNAEQLQQLSQANSGNGVTQHDAAGALAQVVGSGAFSGDAVEMVAKTAARMKETVGQSVGETVQQFMRLQEDPVNAAQALDNSIHFLTASQLEQIRVFGEQGRTTDAAKIAMSAYADVMDRRLTGVDNNLGWLEKAWKAIGDTAALSWDKMLDIGREDTIDEKIAVLRKKINDGGQQIGRVFIPVSKDDRDNLTELEKQKSQNDSKNARDKADREEQERLKRRDQQNAELNRINETEAYRHMRILANIDSKGDADKDVRDAARRRENERYNKTLNQQNSVRPVRPVHLSADDRHNESAESELLSLQAQLKGLQHYTPVKDPVSKQREDLQQAQNLYAVLEAAGRSQLPAREKTLLDGKNETLENKRKLADIGDEIARQNKRNDLDDQAVKFAQQQNVVRDGFKSQANGLSSRNMSRKTTLEGLKESYSFNPIAQQKVLTEQQKTYEAEDALRANWLAGAKQGWAEYQESATDVFSSVKQISQTAFSGFSDQLNQLVMTGKASFEEFTSSILKMIIQVINQLIIAYTVQAAMGWISGFAKAPASAAGPTAPLPSYRPPEFDVGGFTGYGNKYEPAGVVHRGEFVFTKDSTSRIGVSNLYRMMNGYAAGGYVDAGASAGAIAGGVSVYAPVSITSQQSGTDGPQGNTDALGRAYQQVVDRSVREGIVRELRPGGIIWSANNGR